ncbi:hypothetical protein [Nostoc sp.]|uniref:hypothetical protein n=1 Tax=Nostoc sp. TaxID=1180 RepID=UPI002FFA06B4
MNSPGYKFKTIQSQAHQLNLESTRLANLVMGLTDEEVTPQTIIENFAKLDERYKALKNRIEAVQTSIDNGHDPYRHLFAYEQENVTLEDGEKESLIVKSCAAFCWDWVMRLISGCKFAIKGRQNNA